MIAFEISQELANDLLLAVEFQIRVVVNVESLKRLDQFRDCLLELMAREEMKQGVADYLVQKLQKKTLLQDEPMTDPEDASISLEDGATKVNPNFIPGDFEKGSGA